MGLPIGISLSGGTLTVEFSGPEQLLERLYRLSQKAGADFERFCEVVTQASKATPSLGPAVHTPPAGQNRL